MDEITLQHYQNDFQSILEHFQLLLDKKITLDQYRIVSGKYGIYPQPNFETTGLHLVRFRVAAGRLNKNKLRFLLMSIAKYKISQIKLIHTQSIQIHDLELSKIFELILEAYDYSLISLGSGSNFPRNVVCSPLSGVEAGEYMNVLPYAELANQFLVEQMNEMHLPDKLEIAFSNSPKNVSRATFTDLGFVARSNKCFDVYIAGGLSIEPKLGVLAASNISPRKILYYIQAMLALYAKHGVFRDRSKSRSSYLQYIFGTKDLITKYSEEVSNLLENVDLNIQHSPRSVTKSGNGSIPLNRRIFAQKQKNLYYVEYKPICGYMDAESFKRIYSIVEPMNQVEIRVTPSSSLFIINLNAREAFRVYEATGGGANNALETAFTCAGSRYCTRGLADTDGLLLESIEKFRFESVNADVLPQIRISGCEISCSSHQVAGLGFQGTKAQHGEKDAFYIYYSGNDTQNLEIFSEPSAMILAEQIPNFLFDLCHELKLSNQMYPAWIKEHSDRMETLIQKYRV